MNFLPGPIRLEFSPRVSNPEQRERGILCGGLSHKGIHTMANGLIIGPAPRMQFENFN